MLHTLKNSKKLLAFQQAKMQQTAAFLPTRFHRVMVSKLTFKHEGSEFESRSSQVFLIFFSRNDYFSFVPRIILRQNLGRKKIQNNAHGSNPGLVKYFHFFFSPRNDYFCDTHFFLSPSGILNNFYSVSHNEESKVNQL